MPIYEFLCPRNQRIYSFLARSLAYSGKTPRCPDNAKWPMEKMLSSFAVTGRAKEAAPGGDAPDDPRMDKAMAEMEREFSSMGDAENPDPRTIARMMRRMTELGGDKVPAQMQEMIARLEKGEDPEKLEAEYGDAFDDFDMGEGDDAPSDSTKSARRKRPRITRDPTLYEMGEYCE